MMNTEELLEMLDEPMLEGSDDDLDLAIGSSDEEVNIACTYYILDAHAHCNKYSTRGNDEHLDYLTRLEREIPSSSSIIYIMGRSKTTTPGMNELLCTFNYTIDIYPIMCIECSRSLSTCPRARYRVQIRRLHHSPTVH